MDKKAAGNRTDLLAAGKKRLQQYRQKKDNRGREGKSSRSSTGKADKSDRPDNEGDVPADHDIRTTGSSQFHDQVVVQHDGSISSDSVTVENSVDGATVVDPMPLPNIEGKGHTAVAGDAQVSLEDLKAVETSVSDELGSSMGDRGNVDTGTKDSEIGATGRSPFNSNGASICENGGDINADAEGQQKEAQVSDVGAIQGADLLGSMQYDDGSPELDITQSHALSEFTNDFSAEATVFPQLAADALETYDPVENIEPEVSISASDVKDGDTEMTDAITSSQEIPIGVENVFETPIELHRKSEDSVDGNPDKGPSCLLLASEDFGKIGKEPGQDISILDEGTGKQYSYDGSNTSESSSHESVLEVKAENSAGDGTIPCCTNEVSDNLSQPDVVPEGLTEDEMGLANISRSSVDMGGHTIPMSSVADFPQTFQEQLYLASILRDFSLLQHHEQSQEQLVSYCENRKLVDEISTLNVSLRNANELNNSLNVELARCKSELQDAKDELHDIVQSAKEQENKSSAALDELKRKLADCNDLLAASHAENNRLLKNISSLMDEKNKLEEVNEHFLSENKGLSASLSDYQNSLASLQEEIANLNMKIDFATSQGRKLEEEKVYVFRENEHLSGNLAECKHILASLQEENARLNMTLATGMDDRKKLLEDKEFLVRESQRLSSEIVGYQEKLSAEHNQRLQLEDDLNDVTEQLEGMIEENFCLQNSLGICKTTLIDLDCIQRGLFREAAEAGNRGSSHSGAAGASDTHRNHVKQLDVSSHLFAEAVSDIFNERPHVKELNLDLRDDSGFETLKRHLKEAEFAVEELEKAVDGMHTYSVSLSQSKDKDAIPPVSKLIQAFESKAVFDGHDSGRTSSTESQMHHDSYLSAKDEVQKLRGVLEALSEDAEHVSSLFSKEKDSGFTANFVSVEFETEMRSLKDYNSILELRSIELEVLYAAFEQHAYSAEADKIKLKTLYESLKVKEASQRAEKLYLQEKLTDCQRRISELHDNLRQLRINSSDFMPEVSNQMGYLQKQMVEYVIAAEGGRKSTLASIMHLVEKLDAAIEKSTSPGSANGDTSARLDHISASVVAAYEEIQGLKTRINATANERDTLSSLYEDTGKKYDALLAENERASSLLKSICGGLLSVLYNLPGHAGEVESQKFEYSHHDPLDADYYGVLIKEVSRLFSEMGQLKEVNDNLRLELLGATNIIEEMKKKMINPHDVLTLVQDVIEVQDVKTNLDEPPLQLLQSVSLLVRKYREVSQDSTLLEGDIKCKVLELGELQNQFDQLKSLNLELQNEIVVFKESLIQAKDTAVALQGALKDKTIELEQSEQRVASVREKLGIAVAKGKGLVVQRDSLKQSLGETSSELERCAQELRSKDSRIYELGEKLKAYSEAGERMEALESELSYIRNSATALRESFLLKDATLQRIEEILEDLELSQRFHSQGVIEKVDWLAKSVSGNSAPPLDSDQRTQSDPGLVMIDAWKEEGEVNANPVDDLRRKYDELQTKFYELAEQNEMLEQSLMERNNLVQRWEEVLDRINTPVQLRSMEPEERIEWLGCALSEADNHLRSLHQKIDHLENYSGLLSADLEESQNRISSLESSLQEVVHEKEQLSGRLESVTSDHGKALGNVDLLEHEADRLRSEVIALQEKMAVKLEHEDQIRHIDGEICRLQNLIIDALSDSGSEAIASDGNEIKRLEQLLRKLIGDYSRGSVESSESQTTLPEHGSNLDERYHWEAGDEQTHHTDSDLGKTRSIDTVAEKEETVVDLSRELERVRSELVQLKEERDEFMEKCQSLTTGMESLAKDKEDLQELVSQGEQKSASLRDKLNVAVRKGKSVVQQRDSLKQAFDDTTAEVGRLKSELNFRESTILELEKKMSEMSALLDRNTALEAESIFLKNQLMEVKQVVENREMTLSIVFNKIDEISFTGLADVSDPVLKLDGIRRMCSDLHTTLSSSQEETVKSKRAAELLLAELNEVQERNDGLQEELGKAYDDMSNLSKEKEAAISAKLELLSHVDKLSEERRKQLLQFEVLKSSFNEVQKGFFEINNLTADIFVKDVELLNNLRASMGSTEKQIESAAVGVTGRTRKKGFLGAASFWESMKSDSSSDAAGLNTLQDLLSEIGVLKERITRHLILLEEEAGLLINDVSNLQGEVVSQKESLESITNEFARLASMGKEKDMEISVLHRSIALLFEACEGSIMEIESGKVQIFGNVSAVGHAGGSLKSLALPDRETSFNTETLSEEFVKDLTNRLVFAVKEFIGIQANSVGGQHNELRSTVSQLQKELQEKDAQNERIHSELVSQIKEAKASAAKYAQDLEYAKNQVHDSVSRLKVMEEERNLLEQKLADLQQKHVISIDYQEKVKSLTDMLATKEQEAEALMQVLDEDGNQMEGLRSKIQEMEEVIQKKNMDLQNLESSRAKAMKKLSVTVSKFDELHHMSEDLLSEIENLQSQLQERDSEILFLRQEVTRCTNDVLSASKMTKERSSAELHELLAWLDSLCSQVLTRDVQIGDSNSQGQEYKERLQKDIASLVSELESLRIVAQSKDVLLNAERDRVKELLLRKEALEVSLRQKETELSVLGDRDSGEAASEIVEVEPLIKKWSAPVTSTASQVRSLRKANNDHVISIDADAGDTGRVQDEDDDKMHGFKSLTTSRLVPKFTRPLSDMVDGLWVSCDRALMRQPAFRLGIMIYWIVFHGLLASFVV
ncbi:Trans-Golgi network-localized SYP41-interacting protein 1-like protein [Drosera capensis]